MQKLKNELRNEMRVTAMEAAGRGGSGSAPVVVSNNMMGGGGAPAGPTVVTVAPRPTVLKEESYCGCKSCCIGIIFPCICCCPVDTRTVRY